MDIILGVLKFVASISYPDWQNRFMDTWGTHVAKDTLVGGMFEQQIVMKDCVWQSPYLTGGLTPEKLEEYLKLDLANAPPQASCL